MNTRQPVLYRSPPTHSLTILSHTNTNTNPNTEKHTNTDPHTHTNTNLQRIKI